jgi:hypothetical protein
MYNDISSVGSIRRGTDLSGFEPESEAPEASVISKLHYRPRICRLISSGINRFSHRFFFRSSQHRQRSEGKKSGKEYTRKTLRLRTEKRVEYYSLGGSFSGFLPLNSVYPHFPQLSRSLWSARNTPSPHFGQLFRCRTILSPSTLNTSRFIMGYSFFASGGFSAGFSFGSAFCGFSLGSSFFSSPSFFVSFLGFFFVPRLFRFKIGSASPAFAASTEV